MDISQLHNITEVYYYMLKFTTMCLASTDKMNGYQSITQHEFSKAHSSKLDHIVVNLPEDGVVG